MLSDWSNSSWATLDSVALVRRAKMSLVSFKANVAFCFRARLLSWMPLVRSCSCRMGSSSFCWLRPCFGRAPFCGWLGPPSLSSYSLCYWPAPRHAWLDQLALHACSLHLWVASAFVWLDLTFCMFASMHFQISPLTSMCILHVGLVLPCILFLLFSTNKWILPSNTMIKSNLVEHAKKHCSQWLWRLLVCHEFLYVHGKEHSKMVSYDVWSVRPSIRVVENIHKCRSIHGMCLLS